MMKRAKGHSTLTNSSLVSKNGHWLWNPAAWAFCCLTTPCDALYFLLKREVSEQRISPSPFSAIVCTTKKKNTHQMRDIVFLNILSLQIFFADPSPFLPLLDSSILDPHGTICKSNLQEASCGSEGSCPSLTLSPLFLSLCT